MGAQRQAPAALPPGKGIRYQLYKRLGGCGCEKYRPHRDSNPDLPIRSESLYRLSYQGLLQKKRWFQYKMYFIRNLNSASYTFTEEPKTHRQTSREIQKESSIR